MRLSPDQLLANLSPDQLLAHLSAEQRLEGLPLEEIENYMRKRKAAEDKSSPQPPQPLG